MMRELIERFSYRYRLWVDEKQGDKVGAGTPPVPISPKNEPAPRMILRFLWVMVCGLMLLAGLGRIFSHAFPTARQGIAIIVIALATIWCAVTLFIIAGELLTKRSEKGGDDKIT